MNNGSATLCRLWENYYIYDTTALLKRINEIDQSNKDNIDKSNREFQSKLAGHKMVNGTLYIITA